MNDQHKGDFQPGYGRTIGQHKGVRYRVQRLASRWAFRTNGKAPWFGLHKTKKACVSAAKEHIDRKIGS